MKENGVETSVSKIKETIKKRSIHRPNIPEGDFNLFASMSVHCGDNIEGFDTRFSLDIRLEIVS